MTAVWSGSVGYSFDGLVFGELCLRSDLFSKFSGFCVFGGLDFVTLQPFGIKMSKKKVCKNHFHEKHTLLTFMRSRSIEKDTLLTSNLLFAGRLQGKE